MGTEMMSRKILKDVPSASGIEHIDDQFWLMSDNSPWLFLLDLDLNCVDRIEVSDTLNLVNGVIAKKDKHDLEGMVHFVDQGTSVVLLFGSGSKWPSRNTAVLVNTSTKRVIEKFDLSELYELIMEEAKLKEAELNIEAATVVQDEILLFNRGKNKLIKLKRDQLMQFLRKREKSIKIKSYTIDLPSIDDVEAGFSGATYDTVQNKIFFTASVENTSDWVADGTVLGSFIGTIDLSMIHNHYEPKCTILNEEGHTAIVKVESVAILSSEKTKVKCVLVTDNDEGESELITVEFDPN